MCPIRMFFSKKTQMLRTKFFVIRSLLTLLEEKTLSPDLLHPSGQFHLTVSQLVKPFKYLTKLSRSLLEPFGFKCKRLLFKCFLGLIVMLMIMEYHFLIYLLTCFHTNPLNNYLPPLPCCSSYHYEG